MRRCPATSVWQRPPGKGPSRAASPLLTGRPLPLSLRELGASRKGRSSARLWATSGCPGAHCSCWAPPHSLVPGLRSSFCPPLPLYLLFIPSKYVLTLTVCQSLARSWGQTVRKNTPHLAVREFTDWWGRKTSENN